MTALTKRQFRALLAEDLGRDALDADIARFCGISAAAVSQWDEDRAVPEVRVLRAMVQRPDLFGRLADAAANDDARPADGPGAIEGAH